MSQHAKGQQYPWIAAAVATLTSIATCSSFWYLHHRRVVNKLEQKWNQERQAERTGRIRAEVKLRTASKQASENDGNNMTLKRIGTVVSPYTKRMGTPRQGALVPASRAFVQLSIPMVTLDGLDQYSHAWLIFEFHANTDLAESKKTKIRPPRGGGIKVGQLATRSPHRPNALGLSLVKIERLDIPNKRFYVSALDLCNGTPIYDIKPCVPWDVPGKFDGLPLKVPDWVDGDDALSQVSFTESAEVKLRTMISNKLLDPLYTTKNDGLAEGAMETLKQVLAQDPRASRKRGTSTRTTEASYRIVFCKVEVEFRVIDGTVEVINVVPADFSDEDFVDGIPLSKTHDAKTN
jgi:tRNA-Thr(GGU) m(6)t(6)A37 methyltransferase TsaA